MTAQSSFRSIAIVVVCGAFMVTISMGIRQSFGIFQQAMITELGTGREAFGLALAIQNLLLGLPLIGLFADRFGARLVALIGGLLYGVGLVAMAFVNNVPTLYLSFGALVGASIGATAYVVVLGAVARVVPPEKRSTAFGITTAAGSFGMFAFVPLAQWLLSWMDWQTSFLILAGVAASMALLALGFPGGTRRGRALGAQPDIEDYTLTQTLQRAQRHSGYWLLNAGFFVCGFHVAFITAHLPAYLNDNGIDPLASATAFSLIGFANIIGSYLFGMLGDRYRKKYLLGLLYFVRAIVIGLFLLLPLTGASAIVFGLAIGFLWLATVPLTSGMVAQIFGSRYLATLYGIVFFSHQIGAFLGAWLGGRLYDTTGSYDVVWMIAFALGVFAALIHLPIADAPVQRAPAVSAQ
ncbi:MAG: MFS transporter [Chloroflexaceae bacterium]|nr:MFS transporter [Chloroflexaceae bacterium]NJL33969.1 MFS transporter [Chloroflexaceae bacterium]